MQTLVACVLSTMLWAQTPAAAAKSSPVMRGTRPFLDPVLVPLEVTEHRPDFGQEPFGLMPGGVVVFPAREIVYTHR
jgi:hypothetical protein